jgi:hypothetical protein
LLEERLARAKEDKSHVESAKEGAYHLSSFVILSLGDDAVPFLKKAEDAIATFLDQREGMKMDSELVKKLCDEHSKKYVKLFPFFRY